MAGAFLVVLAVGRAVLLPAFADLCPVFVNMQAVLQLLGAAVLLGSRMALALLFA